jgi:hypothetical protein
MTHQQAFLQAIDPGPDDDVNLRTLNLDRTCPGNSTGLSARMLPREA